MEESRYGSKREHSEFFYGRSFFKKPRNFRHTTRNKSLRMKEQAVLMENYELTRIGA